MFKAKLIEKENYYKLRSKQLLLMLLPSIPIAFLVQFYQIPIWVSVLMIGVYITLFVYILKNQKQINAILGNRIIEMDQNEIIIKSKKGVEEERINLNNVEKIILNDEYKMAQENLKDFGEELRGKAKRNYIILQQNGHKRQLDFEIDSHYKINQINKLIENWEKNGFIIEQMNKN